MTELTGRRRHRINKEYGYSRGTLILQVEEAYWQDQLNRWQCRWRDATPDDVQPSELK